MSIERSYGKYIPVCDVCGEELLHEEDFYDAVDAKKQARWISVKDRRMAGYLPGVPEDQWVRRTLMAEYIDSSGMTNDAAIPILECMAIDLAGGLTGLSRMNPMYDVLKQRLEAINMALEALKKEGGE